MCKLRPKVRNVQNLPPWKSEFYKIFLCIILCTNSAMFPQVWHHISRTVFSKKNLLFSTRNSKMSMNKCIWRHKLWNAKTGVGPTFTWSNEPWYMAEALFSCFDFDILQGGRAGGWGCEGIDPNTNKFKGLFFLPKFGHEKWLFWIWIWIWIWHIQIC